MTKQGQLVAHRVRNLLTEIMYHAEPSWENREEHMTAIKNTVRQIDGLLITYLNHEHPDCPLMDQCPLAMKASDESDDSSGLAD